MPSLRKRNLNYETSIAIAVTPVVEQKKNGASSEYEQSREKRIKENLERMQKLGIIDLSLKFNSSIPPANTNKRRGSRPCSKTGLRPMFPVGPTRRSSRLQNATPVSYTEVKLSRKEEDEYIMKLEGSRPEAYTEEHEKLLGDCKMSWELFVDGYGKDGKRIYDPVKGKTCHQCRQKTLGHRTQCSKCDLVQGQFCGDCLYMRYGEHVLEAKQNPDWICPPCRGICNCSLCRQAKGWPPTGTLYRKISSLGYKSVAHYLIQTRRSQTNSGEDSKTPLSVKRSLPFSDPELSKMSDLVDTNNGEKKDVELEVKRNDDMQIPETLVDASKSVPQSSPESKTCDIISEPNLDSLGGRLKKRRKQENDIGDKGMYETEVNRHKDVQIVGNVDISATSTALEKNLKTRKLDIVSEPNPVGVAGRLRQRRKQECNSEYKRIDEIEVKRTEGVGFEENALTAQDVSPMNSSEKKKSNLNNESGPDSVAGRLKQRRTQEINTGGRKNDETEVKRNEDMHFQEVTNANNTALGNGSENKKCDLSNERSPSSIAGRLRPRRKQEKWLQCGGST